jgi:hypothetical protein
VLRGRGRGNCFADIGDVDKYEEAMHDDKLTICVQHMKGQFANIFEQLGERMNA